MLSFEQPFISLCHQRQMPLSLQQSICTKMFSEKENGWVSDPFSNKLNLTGICYNENSFSKLTFASKQGKSGNFGRGFACQTSPVRNTSRENETLYGTPCADSAHISI